MQFNDFNQSRDVLIQQFYDIISLAGNHIFHCDIDSSFDLLQEINRQKQLSEPEKNALRHIYYYAETLKKSRFLVGVLGRFKSGKSTLLNALAGEDISPMNTRISTGVLNFTYWNDVEECKVQYDSGAEINIDPSEKIQYIDAQLNPDNEKCIRSVSHGAPTFHLQKEIIFVDTPGLDAVQEVHERITLDFIIQCHAGVIVSTYPPFGASELQFYKKTKETIKKIFLVQNLPEDKLKDWIELEVQTLENLYKLGFYDLTDYEKNRTLHAILRNIADKKNVVALNEFKEQHNIHLFSLNAKQAYEAIQNNDEIALQKSRFNLFQQELYDFLSIQKGQELIQNYVHKGMIILDELIEMIQYRQTLLRQSLEEIQQEIKTQESKRRHAKNVIERISDKLTLNTLQNYKNLKNECIDVKIPALKEDITKINSEKNLFLFSKNNQKDMKLKIAEFNRLLGQDIQKYVHDLEDSINEAQEQIKNEIDTKELFGKISIVNNFSDISIEDMVDAGKIDKGIRWTFRAGLGYIGCTGLASLFGGFLPFVIGGALGLLLALPLEKKIAPWIDKGKNFIGKFFQRNIDDVFAELTQKVKEEFDHFEKNIIEIGLQDFQQQVEKAINEYFLLIKQRLEEIKERKANTLTQKQCEKECRQLDEVIEQLNHIKNAMNPEIEKQQEEIESLPFSSVFSTLKKIFS